MFMFNKNTPWAVTASPAESKSILRGCEPTLAQIGPPTQRETLYGWMVHVAREYTTFYLVFGGIWWILAALLSVANWWRATFRRNEVLEGILGGFSEWYTRGAAIDDCAGFVEQR